MKIFKKIDDIREHVENVIAKGLLKIRGNNKVDQVEILISNTVMKAIEVKFGITIPSNVKQEINKGVVNGCNTINMVLVNQLEK